MHAEGCSRFHISGAIIHKQRFLRQRLLAAEHHLEYLASRLHHLTPKTQVEGIEEMADGVTLTVEVFLGPLHDEGIRIRQQTNLEASCPEAEKSLQIALWHMVHITSPGRTTLVHRQIPAHQPTQFSAKILCRDTATLQVAKDAFLFEGIQTLAGILQTDGLKATHITTPPKSNAIFLIITRLLCFRCKITKLSSII